MKNLENYGVQELSTKVSESVNGGFWWVEMWGGTNFIRLNYNFNQVDTKEYYA